ncbi:beta-lactamase class A [Actinoplanes campanulatus]|uniref:Beta-lactamase class A n=1 Tax=Actinoplanes campanulatus TaxID=113559 RepID=A0A7W5FJ92_9ACTN|nr:serine hydrolase [Actinoplanes campanulatus]MBB3100362.1 beta-lactamase class A [Actinoplanes campanulatus]GGN43671.1 serine hydrolase [Actinoplanes campanulatus]GID40836.1 serine hydrolase [Actinoplanes campanulatus]
MSRPPTVPDDAEYWLHARDIDSGRCTGHRSGEPVVIGSIFKILLVLEYARQVAAGALDPAERVLLGPGDRLGGWGTGGCADDVELSLRDLAYFTMSVSDNTAADALMRRVGPDLVPLLAAELGLTRTRVTGGPRDQLSSMFADVGAADDAAFARIFPTLTDDQVRRLRIYDPEQTTSSTPEEITRLLRMIWQDAAGPAEACATVRALMARQMFWTRLAAAFPAGVRVSGKTGTLPGLHMEAGVAEYPDGGRYALAVFVRTRNLATARLDVDMMLGRAAADAVRRLRDE